MKDKMIDYAIVGMMVFCLSCMIGYTIYLTAKPGGALDHAIGVTQQEIENAKKK